MGARLEKIQLSNKLIRAEPRGHVPRPLLRFTAVRNTQTSIKTLLVNHIPAFLLNHGAFFSFTLLQSKWASSSVKQKDSGPSERI